MGITKKKHYKSYTLAFKVKAAKENKKQGVKGHRANSITHCLRTL